MPQHPVRIAIRITDHSSGDVTQDLDVSGSYDPETHCLCYTEPEPLAQVSLTLRDHSATLLRQGEWTTILEFVPDGHFNVESDQGILFGQLEVLNFVRTLTTITIEYRLFTDQGELAHSTYTLTLKGPLS
jgi:hypothetical protein